MVNRVWKWHFGTGIVNTPSNFGQVGERPSHPDLLEYLATKFVDSGMSVKQLQRDILLSYTYRQSSDPNEDALAKDPQNRLYWRFNRQRLDSEQIRDSILFVSGLLKDDKVGGPSKDIDDSEFHRRALYGQVSRFNLADYDATFDFPNPGLSASQRFVTSVPLQRLFFMNSELVYNAASKLVERASKAPEAEAAEKAKADKDNKAKKEKAEESKPPVKLTNDQKIARAYEILFQRDPTQGELTAGLRVPLRREEQEGQRRLPGRARDGMEPLCPRAAQLERVSIHQLKGGLSRCTNERNLLLAARPSAPWARASA